MRSDAEELAALLDWLLRAGIGVGHVRVGTAEVSLLPPPTPARAEDGGSFVPEPEVPQRPGPTNYVELFEERLRNRGGDR